MSKPTITAVIPCYNEEGSIQKTIKRLGNKVDEILVVDNGSTDRSREVALNYGATVISEPRKQNGIGYGYAIIAGLKAATSDYVITIDADGEHPIEDVQNIVNYVAENNLDFVSCNRTVTESSKVNTKIRRLGIWLLSQEVNVLYGYPLQDVLSGMWVIKTSIVPRLNLSRGDWNLSPEIKLSALTKPGVRFGEYPIVATVRDAGKSKQILWKTALAHASFIFAFRFGLLTAPVTQGAKGVVQQLLTLRK